MDAFQNYNLNELQVNYFKANDIYVTCKCSLIACQFSNNFKQVHTDL